MNSHKLLLYLYPRTWRARYEDEFLELLEQRTLSFSDTIDVILEAIDAHLHPQFGTKNLQLSERLRHLVRTLQGTLILLFCAYSSFVIAGIAFEKMTEAHAFIYAANIYSTVGIPFALIVISAIVALLGILVGGLPIISAVIKAAFAARRWSPLLLLTVPLCVSAGFIATITMISHTSANQPPETIDRIIFFGGFLFVAAISTGAVSAAVVQSHIAARQLRFAMLPSVVVTLAMLLMLLATIFWGLNIQKIQPDLFASNSGILATSTTGTWLGIIIVMAISTLIATTALIRGISVHSTLCTIDSHSTRA